MLAVSPFDDPTDEYNVACKARWYVPIRYKVDIAKKEATEKMSEQKRKKWFHRKISVTVCSGTRLRCSSAGCVVCPVCVSFAGRTFAPGAGALVSTT
jgi:hypothetical protein